MYNPLLTTFACVADCGSFGKAAETLFLSPPSVMKQVNALEKHLGLRLFDRGPRGVRLTPAGRVVYRYAKQLFALSETALAEARREAERAETTLCIGSSLLNPCKPFMNLWYPISGAFPGYKLHIVPFEDDHAGILSEIAALGEKFDFLVGVCDSALWLDRCRFFQLGTYQHCIAVPRSHRLAGRKRLRVSDLHGETVMMVRAGDSPTVDGIRAELRRHPQITIEDTPQFYDIEVFNRCEQTRHPMVTIECWAEVHPALVTIPVEWDHPIPYGLLYALDPPDDVRAVLRALENHLHK